MTGLGVFSAAPERPAASAAEIEPLVAWLTSSRVVPADGAVMSWWNPQASGYRYPEAAGLWLSLLCGEPELAASVPPGMADAVAGWLCSEVVRSGAAGRRGLLYAFDSGIALSGLAAYAKLGGPVDVRAAAGLLVDFIARSVASGQPVQPALCAAPCHWSDRNGAHMLKAAMGLDRWAEFAGSDAARAVAASMVAMAGPVFDGERVAATDGTDVAYLHATLYGLEGLAWQHARRLGDHAETLHRGSAFAASIQQPGGGVSPFWNGRLAYGNPRADSTAQAVRLWLLVDPIRWGAAIERGIGFLGSLAVPRGGLRYHAGSDDENTWATLFAVQALLWRRHGPTPLSLT